MIRKPTYTKNPAKKILKIFWPGKITGLPVTNPWSLPNAIKLPVNVNVPTKTEKIIVDSDIIDNGYMVSTIEIIIKKIN